MNKQKKNESIYKRMILLFLLITGVGGVSMMVTIPYLLSSPIVP